MACPQAIVEQYDRRNRTDFVMRIATYNIHKSVGLDRKRNPKRILDVLNEVDADLVFLQEVDRRTGKRETTISSALLSEHTDYQAAEINIREHSLGWHGNVILARKNIQIKKAWRIELPTLEPRGAVAADIVVDNITIRCVGAHLGLVPQTRNMQVKKIVEELDRQPLQSPVIVAGDFNEWRKTKGCIRHFGDGFLALDPKPSFYSALPFMALDRIVISSEINRIDDAVHISENSKMASDHLPIWADLLLPKPKKAGRNVAR